MFTLFGSPNLAIPLPSTFPATSPPPNADDPILVYGAGASSGQYVLQLFALAGYTQIYVTASPRHHTYLKALGAKACFDYRSPSFAQDILAASNGVKMSIVVDTISAKPSIEAYSAVLSKETRLAMLMPVKKGTAVTNEEDDDMTLEVQPWVQEIVGEATVIPVTALTMMQVRPVSRSHWLVFGPNTR